MRYAIYRAVVFCAVALSFSLAARADLITITISQPLTVNLITSTTTIPFHNKIVTYKAMLTTESLAACDSPQLNYGCIYNDDDPSVVYVVDGSGGAGASATWTIEGSGTYLAYIPYIFFSFQGSPDHPHDISVRSGGDVEGHGSLPDPFIANPNGPFEPCADENPCPVEANTSGGTIQFIGIDGPATTTVEVTPESAVPEPSTFALLGSGFSAAGMMFLRRRRVSLRNS